MKKGDAIDDKYHILRYVGGGSVDKDDKTDEVVIIGNAFLSKPKDNNCPSYNWLEYFSGTTEDQVEAVRKSSRIDYGSTAVLVRLNIGEARAKVKAATEDNRIVEVIYDPLEAAENKPADPSHALMTNIPEKKEDDPEGEKIGDIIATCKLQIFPAKVAKA
jgi:hypothetical protein